MGIFPIAFISKNTFTRIAAALLVGTLLGAAVMLLTVAYRIDELTLEIQRLEHELSVQKEENENLQLLLEEKRYHQKIVVETIEPTFIFPENTFTKYEQEALQIELGKKVINLLQDLKGQEVNTVDYHLVPRIIDARQINILDRNLKMHVEGTVIAKKLLIYIRVVPEKKQSVNDI